MAPSRTGIEIPDRDPVREYTEDEQRRLTQNLYALLLRVHRGEFSEWSVDRALIRELHSALFVGVRGHAGRQRSRSFGSERLTFGPHRSSHRKDVEAELDAVLRWTSAAIRELERTPVDQAWVREAFRLAARSHADLIRIHPFEDGNGRIGRALMDLVLLKLGLGPVALEVPKQEYLDCLNLYFTQGDLEPLVDLLLALQDT